MQIVMTGGTGFLGRALAGALRSDNHQVTVLTRQPRQAGERRWAPETAARDHDWMKVVDDADAVVNLAGSPIAGGRWTAARKQAIRDSRVVATRAIVTAISNARRTPPVFISMSAIGIYGPHDNDAVTEETPAGSDFLAGVVRDWEAEARAASSARVVVPRTGVVLARHGGALPQLALPFHFGVGGRLGSGRQYISWIHLEDWVAIIRWALRTDTVSGPLNATAPEPVTNADFASALGRVLRRPAIIPAPAFALRLALGEMADAVILTGQRVLPAKAQALGFEFRHPSLERAVREIYGR